MSNLLESLAASIEMIFLWRLPTAVAVFLVGYVAVRVIQAAARSALAAARVTKVLQEVIMTVVGILLWIGVAALVFQGLGLNQVAIAISGSVAVIILGVATGANKVVADISAGLSLARNRDFKIGQRIRIADVEGQVSSLDGRRVRILAADGAVHVIPNSKFDENSWCVLPNGRGDG